MNINGRSVSFFDTQVEENFPVAWIRNVIKTQFTHTNDKEKKELQETIARAQTELNNAQARLAKLC